MRFVVLGKTVNYRQDSAGALRLLNYHFFGEAFQAAGHAGTATLTDPSGRSQPFRPGAVMTVGGERDFDSLQGLNAAMPDGRYRIDYQDATPADAVHGELALQSAAGAFANPVHLTLLQDGVAVMPQEVNPALDLVIRWSPFRGRDDPAGISGDLIFVHLGDCHGTLIARTPAPFGDGTPLTWRVPDYRVPAGTLRGGETYQISVEHAPLRTSRLAGTPALATYPATTFLDLHTRGGDSGNCPTTPWRMDRGQSDRSAAPVAPTPTTATAPVTAASAVAADAGRDIRFFVVVKSSNYAQQPDGQLRLLNYHFFSEVFPVPGVHAQAQLLTPGASQPRVYGPQGDTLYVEGGHFRTQQDLDRAYPNGQYEVSITAARTALQRAPLRLAGPAGRTDIPRSIHITVEQDGAKVPPGRIDAARPVTLRWSAFSNGRADPHGIVDDMIFVVVQDCLGKRLFHTGLPFDGPYLRHTAREARLPAGLLAPGEPYAMFVEMPHVSDSVRSNGVPGFASYATATYLDLHTQGAAQRSCPATPPAMDTGQTDRAAANSAAAATGGTAAPEAAAAATGGVTEQVTFLYYSDLAAPRRFYGETLGFKAYLQNDWVTLYRTTTGSTIGLVRTAAGAAPSSGKHDVVMVSLVSEDVVRWYEKLRADTRVRITKPLYDHPAVPIRAFEMEDPGGYPIEFFQWLKH